MTVEVVNANSDDINATATQQNGTHSAATNVVPVDMMAILIDVL